MSASMTSLLFEISNTDSGQRLSSVSIIPDKPIEVIPFDRTSKYVRYRDFYDLRSNEINCDYDKLHFVDRDNSNLNKIPKEDSGSDGIKVRTYDRTSTPQHRICSPLSPRALPVIFNRTS